MRTKNMKKALSLFLAVLMIALAIPFTLLTVSAEGGETNKLDITNVKLQGWRLTSTKSQAFKLSMSNEKLYNGVISDDEEVVTTTISGDTDKLSDFKKTSYFDADGKYVCSQTETANGEYYVVYFVELAELSAVDTFSLWTNSGRTSKWAGPNGYDIWYSADGETYETDSSLSFSGIYDTAKSQVDPDIYSDGTWTNPDGKQLDKIVHHIDMNGVEAKCIAIAVTEGAYGSTKTFQSILYELVVEGEVIEIPEEPESVPLDITKVKLQGWRLTSTRSEAFRLSASSTSLYDGDIVKDIVTTTYSSNEDAKSDFKKTSYFDSDGKYVCSQTETANGKYYVVYFVELAELSSVDTFSFWADSSRTSKYACSNGYDIWYSADGETYETNSSLSFSGIRDNTQVDPDIYVSDTWTKPDGSTMGCIAHHVDLNGVEAQYIAIAVTEGVYGTTNTFQSLFYEFTVEGIVLPKPETTAANFASVELRAYNNSGNEFGFGSQGGENAIDGILHDSEGYAISAKRHDLTPNTYFNEYGRISCKNGGDYYGVVIAELVEMTTLDTFTIWTPNSITGTWFDNDAYDIYYSIDGVTFFAVEGASFTDVRNTDCFEQVPTADFPGTATSGNTTGDIYRNDVDMKGVTAKYVAIAVKETLLVTDGDKESENYGLPTKQIGIYEITAEGTSAVGTSANMFLEGGASIRKDKPTGLRFTGLIDKAYVDGLRAENKEATIGMLITPTDYLTDNGLAFTKEALDAWDYDGLKYLDFDKADELTEGDYYKINCVIANIQEANYDRDFSAILYVMIKDGDEVTYIYSAYSEAANSRCVSEIAEAAYHDLKDKKTGEYQNEITVEVAGQQTTRYSPYTATEREMLIGFFRDEKTGAATSVTVMTYNVEVKHSDSNGGWEDRTPVSAIQTVIDANPDIVGFQEDGDDWDTYLAQLTDKGYENISSKYSGGLLSSWGNGWENLDIYYKSAKFEYVTSGFEYYKQIASEYPGVDSTGVDMSIDKNGDDADWWQDENANGRMFSYVVLKDKATGAIILVVNTHLHYGDGTGSDTKDGGKYADDNRLRDYQAGLLSAWLEDMKNTYPNQIVMGDFNATPISKTVRELTVNGGLSQARDTALAISDIGGTGASTSTYDQRQDFIFDHVLYRGVDAEEYTVIDNMIDAQGTRYPSDHLPVFAKFTCYAE